MKKIRHSKDIHHEKLRLRVQQLEQEKALRQGWQELKHDLRPGNLLRSKLAALTGSDKEEGNWLSGLLHYSADYLGRITGKKLGTTLQERVEQWAERLTRKTRR